MRISRSERLVSKVPIPFDQRLATFVRGPLVGLVWLATATLCVVMLNGRTGPLEHRAWIPPVEYEVSTVSSGVLGSVLVQPFQAVSKGELVAQLDPRPLEAKLATAQAEVLRLRAQIADERMRVEADHARVQALAQQDAAGTDANRRMRLEGDLLRSSYDESDLRLSVMELEVLLATDRVGADLLSARFKRARALASDGTGPLAAAADLELELSQSHERINRNEELLQARQAEWQRSRDRVAEIRTTFAAELVAPDLPLIPPATRALEAGIRVQELAIAELELDRGALSLRAPIDGQVSRLYVGEGQSLMAGRAAMLVTATVASEAVVFVEPDMVQVEGLLGRSIELRAGERRSLETVVASISPKAELLPERLWPHPSIPTYALALRVPLRGAGLFLPGEIMRARLLP